MKLANNSSIFEQIVVPRLYFNFVNGRLLLNISILKKIFNKTKLKKCTRKGFNKNNLKV